MRRRSNPDSEPNIRRIDTKTRADRKSTRLNSSHSQISYAVFCLKKKNTTIQLSIIDHRSLLLSATHLSSHVYSLNSSIHPTHRRRFDVNSRSATFTHLAHLLVTA